MCLPLFLRQNIREHIHKSVWSYTLSYSKNVQSFNHIHSISPNMHKQPITQILTTLIHNPLSTLIDLISCNICPLSRIVWIDTSDFLCILGSMSVYNELRINVVRIGVIGCLCMFGLMHMEMIVHHLIMMMCISIQIYEYVVEHSDAKKKRKHTK